MAKKTTSAPVPAKAKPAASKPSAKASAKSTAPAPSKAAAAKPVAKGKAVVKPVVTVTTKHMAAALAEKQDLSKKQADALLADVFGMVVDHLRDGDRVRISGVGIIEVKDRPARMGRNPATGEAIPIKASRKVAFRAAKELKESI